jgi:hypothetical protein
MVGINEAGWNVARHAWNLGTFDGRNVDGPVTEETIGEIAPDPLSGEWADGMTLGAVAVLAGIDTEADPDGWELDAAATFYEAVYFRAFRVACLGHGSVTRSSDYRAGMTASEARVTLADGSTVSVGVHGYGSEDRVIYAWTIREGDGRELAAGTDLRSGSGAEPDARGNRNPVHVPRSVRGIPLLPVSRPRCR